MALGFVLGVATIASSQCDVGPSQVALFEHENYRGRCAVREAGTYPAASAFGLPNDSVSSLKVGDAVWATLCRDDGHAGPCEMFDADRPRLAGTGIGNDTASSLRVDRRPVVVLPQSIFAGRAGPAEFLDQDRDRDGLIDELETVLAEQFQPDLVFDRDENARRAREPIVLFQVRPLGCVGAGCPGRVRLAIRWGFLFVRDGGYGPDTGALGTDWCRDDHPGDNEHATFVLESQDEGRSWDLGEVHLSGERQKIDGRIRWRRERRSGATVFDGWIELNGTHPVIHVSTGKHHMFLHKGDWDDSPYSSVRFWDDCGDDVDSDGALVRSDLRSVGSGLRANNVGEPERHSPESFVDDLRAHFPAQDCPGGRAAWSAEKFCSTVDRNVENWLATELDYRPVPAPVCPRIVQCNPPRRCCATAPPRPGCPGGCTECSGPTGLCN
jgi:hypothetical protein